MTTAYTPLLGLALPVTGELSGQWGVTVNDSITSLLDSAISGTTTLSTDADVTLTTTTGAANTSREAILLCSGARTVLRTITAPAQSKIYTVINATTGGFSVKIVGAGPTAGVTILAGESAVIAWNGSDFIKISSNTSLGALTVTSLTDSGLTSGRVTYAGTGGLLQDSANLTFSGTALAVTGTGSYSGNLTVGTASALYSSRLTVAYSASSSNGPIVVDNRAFGADRGGALWLGGQFNTAGDYRPFGGFVGAKETATDGSSSGYLAFYVNKNAADAAEVGRFTSVGRFIVGATAAVSTMPTTGGVSIQASSTGGGIPMVEIGNTDTTSGSDGSPALMCFKGSATTSSSARFIQFSASNAATTMGAIVGAGSGVCAFANFSDVSLKKNIQPLSGSLAKINALKPSSYDLIADNSHVNAGLIAQDVQQVYPEYVVENMSDEGKPPLMGITGGLSGGFISELICAIQEQQEIIESLKERLDSANI